MVEQQIAEIIRLKFKSIGLSQHRMLKLDSGAPTNAHFNNCLAALKDVTHSGLGDSLFTNPEKFQLMILDCKSGNVQRSLTQDW